MKKTIKRFPLSIEPAQKVKIPFNSEILNFDVLNGEPGLNAIVIDGEDSMERTFLITTLLTELPWTANRTKFVGKFNLSSKDPGKENVFFVFED